MKFYSHVYDGWPTARSRQECGIMFTPPIIPVVITAVVTVVLNSPLPRLILLLAFLSFLFTTNILYYITALFSNLALKGCNCVLIISVVNRRGHVLCDNWSSLFHTVSNGRCCFKTVTATTVILASIITVSVVIAIWFYHTCGITAEFSPFPWLLLQLSQYYRVLLSC